MKIILTTHQFLPDHAAGTEILAYETAKDLQKRGHVVAVFTALYTQKELTDSNRFDRYIYDGIPVERYNFNHQPVSGQTNLMEAEYNNRVIEKYFKNYLEREKPDVVHFFHLAHLSSSPIDACQKLGIPTLLTPTDFWFICPKIELRFPDKQACPGPDEFGSNCVRHFFSNSRYPILNWILMWTPDWMLRMFIVLIKRLGRLNNKHTLKILALSERRGFLQRKINLIDKIIIPTKIMDSVLGKHGLETNRTVTIPFGINLTYLEKASRPEPSESLRLGYIGTLSEHKGAHILLQAMSQLAGKPIKLRIYGKINEESGYFKRLKRLSQGDPRIEFCNTFANAEIGNIFSEMDILVVPSIWHENSPLVVYSAQSARCPVVASNVAGIAEVIEHGRNGILFEPGNVAALTEVINTLLNDRREIQRLSDNAMQPLSIEDYVSRLQVIYNDLTKTRNSL